MAFIITYYNVVNEYTFIIRNCRIYADVVLQAYSVTGLTAAPIDLDMEPRAYGTVKYSAYEQ